MNKFFSIKLIFWLTVLALVISACAPNTPPTAEVTPEASPSPTLTLVEPSSEAGQEERSAKVSELEGEVSWRAAEDETWLPAEVGAILQVGNQVMTGYASRAAILFTEGTVIRLAPNSVFTLQELEGDTENPMTTLELIKGQIFVIVNMLLGQGHLDVDFQSGTAAVRGSCMSVLVTPSGRVVVTCLEGHCTLSDGTITVSLGYGQQAEIEGIDLPPGVASLMEDYQLNAWLLNVPDAYFEAMDLGLIDPDLLAPGCDPVTGSGCFLELECDLLTGIGCDLPSGCDALTGIGCELPSGCNPITGEGCYLPPGCDPVSGVGCETLGGCNLITGEGCDPGDYCLDHPDDPACSSDFCLEHPDDPICSNIDPCLVDPASCLPPPPENPPPLPPLPPPPPPPEPPSWP
jgi:hypothetical protein